MRVRFFQLAVRIVVVAMVASSCANRDAVASSDPKPPPAASAATAAQAPAPAAAAPQTTAPKLRDPDVIYVPTPQEVVDAMLALANVTAKDVVYDLGSGDGRIPITAAQKYGARGVGIDINPERIKEANANLAKAGVGDKVKFLNQDLFETDISQATVVTLYLLPTLNLKLMPTLKKLKPGTRIVSHSFDMGSEWPPEKTQDVDGKTIYFWTIK
jgi:SAM-dependent methyltransferase